MPAQKQIGDLRLEYDEPGERPRPPAERDRFGPLAVRAIDLLVARRSRARLSEPWLARLRAAVLGVDPTGPRAILGAMLEAGIPPADLCDHYIPTVARRLGDEWCADTLSFAEVSIGSARLQSLLRDTALDPAEDDGPEPARANLMVVADEFHTLGALVVTGQLRRLGASVRLVLGRRPRELARLLAGAPFDAVLVSAAKCDDPAAVKQMLTLLRELGGDGLPLIVGGGLLDIGAETVLAETGADHATSDPVEVMRLVGCPETARQQG